ncbi:MAG: Uma2 family endonuclease, partial [Planctomycetota bacterium]|nr:Uma2 family endonuclease [Planctomycetota bacterium]
MQTSRYTRADYMRLPEGFPAELVDGMLVKEPSPTGWHQELGQRLVIRLRERIGPALPSPIDVFIDDYNVLQP